MDGKVVPLVATFIEAHTTLGEADEVVLGFLQLEAVDIKPLVDVARIEEECVGGDGKQRLCQLTDSINIEVLQILRG